MNESQKEANKIALKQLIKENDPQAYLAIDFIDKFFGCGEASDKLRFDIQKAIMQCFATKTACSFPFMFNPNGRHCC